MFIYLHLKRWNLSFDTCNAIVIFLKHWAQKLSFFFFFCLLVCFRKHFREVKLYIPLVATDISLLLVRRASAVIIRTKYHNFSIQSETSIHKRKPKAHKWQDLGSLLVSLFSSSQSNYTSNFEQSYTHLWKIRTHQN